MSSGSKFSLRQLKLLVSESRRWSVAGVDARGITGPRPNAAEHQTERGVGISADAATLHQLEPPGPGGALRPQESRPDEPDAHRPLSRRLQQRPGLSLIEQSSGKLSNNISGEINLKGGLQPFGS